MGNPKKSSSQRRAAEAALVTPIPLRVPAWAFTIAAAVWMLWIAQKDYARILRPFSGGFSDFAQLAASAPAALDFGFVGRILIVAAFWLCALAVGRGLISRLRLDRGARAENLIFSMGLGAGAMSLILLLLGVMGLWHPWILRVALAVGAVAGLLVLQIPAAGEPVPRDPSPPSRLWSGLQSVLIVAAALAIVLGATAPETFYDSLAYHLSIPRLFLLHHRVFPLPLNVFSGPPLGMEMFYGLMLAFDDKCLTALLHGSFALATAASLIFLSLRRAPAAAGRWAAAIFLMCPMTLYAGTSSGVDLGASFYFALAFFAFLRSLDLCPPEDASPRLRWSVLAGLFTGLAMGTKYNAFSFGAALIAVRFWMGRNDKTSARESLAMAIAAFLALSPWLIKNLLFFRNPLYPFLCSSQGSCPADWAGLLANAESRDLRATFLSVQGWKDYLLFAWNSCEGSISMDNWPGSALLMLAPWMLAVRWTQGAAKATAWAALGCYLSWSLASRTGRFLMPGLPVLAYAGAFALEKASVSKSLKALGWAGIVAAAAAAFLANAHQGMIGGRWASLIQNTGRAEFLREDRPGYPAPSYTGFEFVNNRLPGNAKILVLGETRCFHLERDSVSVSLFDENPLWEIVRGARSAEEVRAALAADGVTHLLVNARQLYQGKREVTLPADAVRSPIFAEFWNRWLRVAYEDREGDTTITKWILVCELLERPNGPTTVNPNPLRIVLENLPVPK